MNLYFLKLFLCVLFLVSCEKNKNTKDYNPEISRQLVEQGAILLDVRSLSEFERGSVKGAVNISHKSIYSKKELIKKLTKNGLNKNIVVYCKSGTRAGIAKKILESLGYENVVNHGGINSWKRSL